METVQERTEAERRGSLLRRLDALISSAESTRQTRYVRIITNAIEKTEEGNFAYAETLDNLSDIPVTIGEFIQSRDFVSDQVDLWPEIANDIVRLAPDILAGEEAVSEYFDGGATGTGKTTKALILQAYYLYYFHCYTSPQMQFSLTPSTPLVFPVQSVSRAVTNRVIYNPLRQLFLAMPYTRRYIAHDRYTEASLLLAKNIQLVPLLTTIQSIVGQAIPSGILDEVNFMSVVAQSKQVPGDFGEGGRYDQAELVYTTLSRRRKSRFISRGPVPGCLSVMSSVRYVEDFLDRRIKQIQKNKEPNTRIITRRQYEVQPQDRYTGEKFRLLIGTDHYRTRILEPHEIEGDHYAEGAQIELVPEEYRTDFLNDPDNALRDICGIATHSISPFMTRRETVSQAVEQWQEAGRRIYVEKSNVILTSDGMPRVNRSMLPEDRGEFPRFVHVDLSLKSDRCGIAMVHTPRLFQIVDDEGMISYLPLVIVELVCSIQPSQKEEISVSTVRQWVGSLKKIYGFKVVSVTYDSFQSKESIQQFREEGIRSREISLDRTTEPYEALRSAFYQGRIQMVDNEEARREIVNLEYHAEKDKVDHPPKGSKDMADAIAGAVFAMSTSKEIRMMRNQESGGNMGRKKSIKGLGSRVRPADR